MEGASAFREAFGRRPTHALRAPGRVNWIGEHTDYEEGLVLPCAVDRDTTVFAAKAPGHRVRVISAALGEAEFDARAPTRQAGWIDYVQGVVDALAKRLGPAALAGADLWIDTRVPLEAGLSSSAALSVAVAFAFDRLFDLAQNPRQLALAAHEGESVFVGVGCGILDPFASALGQADHVLRIDCRDGEVTPIAIGETPVSMLIVHSGVERRLAEGGYRERVVECRAAFDAAREAGLVGPDATALRDLSEEALPKLATHVSETVFRRARHVVHENARVDAVCEALAGNDLPRVGELLCAGQASLRDDFEVSLPELDLLCELADEQEAVYGSRLTGAGWGGCSLHLVRPQQAENVAARIASGFARRYGRRPKVLHLRTASGAGDLLEW
ncbi:MAG: galactokinase [Deltaproteobacteria bacterium]|nr:galactokinase [Deltaproteobacteria bacterium]MBW2394744.1 galactokinase [Deltaproteobacteria bacterium]